MINETVWQELAKRSGIAVDKLQEAINSENEQSIELAQVNILTDTELSTLKETVGKDSAKNGAKTMIEMEVKALREKHGLEFEGKTIDNLMNSFADKQIADAKIEPNKKVNDLNESLKSLQSKYANDLGGKDQMISELNSKLSMHKINSDLIKHIPDGLNGIDNNDFITVAKTSATFDYEEGQLVVKQGEKILKDTLEKPISPKDYLTDFATNKNWLSSNGRGGNDSTGGSNSEFKNMNDVMGHMKNNNINPMSPEGQKLVADFENSKK
jgi:hypothetical protein